MREIKFRAKRIDNGNWVYGHYFKTPLTDENSGVSPESGWFFLAGGSRHCIEAEGVAFIIDPETLGEDTGLTDRNGRKIWEGDIIREIDPKYRMDDGKWLWKVEWTEEHACFNVSTIDRKGFIKSDGSPQGTFMSLCEMNDDCEVLGNIYENPELLKGGV